MRSMEVGNREGEEDKRERRHGEMQEVNEKRGVEEMREERDRSGHVIKSNVTLSRYSKNF